MAYKIQTKQVDGLEDYEIIRRKFLALYTLLLHKGIFTEDEINGMLDSMEVIDKLSKSK